MNKNFIYSPEWPPQFKDEKYDFNIQQKKVSKKIISYEWPPEPSFDSKKNYIENYGTLSCGALCLSESEKLIYKPIKWLYNDVTGHCF